MKRIWGAAVLAFVLAVSGCGDGAGNEKPTPQPSAAVSASPSIDVPMPEPSPVASVNQDEQWDNWGDRLPSAGEAEGIVRFARLRFVSADEIHSQLRLAMPKSMMDNTEATFCEGDKDHLDEMVGFGAHWQAKRADIDEYVVCDHEATFSLAEWGENAIAPAPTLSDGIWHVDLGQALAPDDTVGLFRLRLEFGGAVTTASDGGRIDDTAVTWRTDVPATAEAQQR